MAQLHPRIPLATYRLQFNASFTFRDATAITGYLAALGITDAYASSYLKATPGSAHGYDVADPTRLNPEVGSDDEYWAWIGALQARGMGQVLDLVPNHMGIARSANPWWMDVLENGPVSRYASFFDITWRPLKDELADKVLIPTLGAPYGAVLEQRELQLAYRDGAFVVCYYDDWFPVAPDTFPALLRPALEAWVSSADDAPADGDADELRSIITSAEHLPPRVQSATDAEAVATRAREKEIVKRRLHDLVGRCPGLGRHIAQTLLRVNGQQGDARSFDEFDALLAQQSYRLAHWRTASEEINYRRFFDVNQLAALRMEDPAVFEEVHRFVFELIEKGAATGLRVDHVDGLFAPGDYLRRLQARVAAGSELPGDGRPLYLVVEKILGADERLLPSWPVHGTTGYEFAAVVNGLFVERRHEQHFDRIYDRFTGPHGWSSFDDLAYACKKRVMHETMSGDLNSLGFQLNRFSERNRHFRDFTLYSLIAAIKDVIACFPVYRTYLTDEGPLTRHDRGYVQRAVAAAKRASPSLNAPVFDFLQDVLLEPPAIDTAELEERLCFIGKFQQLTSPIAAKGIEDTALYVYNRLLSLNEVGSDPTIFGREVEQVHRWMTERQQQWPAAMSTTATHDTKRGEDLRARLNVLSELPEEWKGELRRWRALNRRAKGSVGGHPAPDANEEYFIYQMLVGAWPLTADDEAGFVSRFEAYVVKALREAKVNTSWLTPNAEYEEAVVAFVRRALDPARPFLARFRAFQRRIADIGMVNSLAQLLVKVTAPGVPDFYQGAELWDFSLVDPDNRRPVDYRRRAELLATLPAPSSAAAAMLMDERVTGRVKLFVMVQALRARRAHRATFESGAYVPLKTTGACADSLLAFARVHPEGTTVTCVPRLVASLPGAPQTGSPTWLDTAVLLPRGLAGATFVNVFTGDSLTVSGQADGSVQLAVADLLASFPVALLAAPTAPRPLGDPQRATTDSAQATGAQRLA